MRGIFAAVAVIVAIGLAGSSGAIASPTKTTVSDKVAPPANATVVAQRCRCVERRWNGSCKLRVCRDRW